jgi:tripartite-type tricarboxylate transporter receptor subunit TctC
MRGALSPIDRRLFLRVVAGLPAISVFVPGARADAPWPAQVITMVVGVAPGGQADIAARPAAQALQAVLRQSVIVENRAGAGGGIAAAYVLRNPPDGYTMLMALSAAVVLPEAERIAGRKPPYEMSDFVPVARVLADPNLLAVRADSPYASVKDLVDDARKRPGAIAYSSSGVLGGVHVCMEMFRQAAGIELLHVPYSGGAPALTALFTGDVAMTALGAAPLKSFSDSGKLRVLATFGAERHPAFPDAPTFREIGYDNVVFYAWVGLFVPKAVPQPVVSYLREAMRQVMTDPQVIAAYARAGTPAAYLDAPEFSDYIAEDRARLMKTIEVIGKAG